MCADRLERAEDFIWRNARLLERQLFVYLFKGGPKEPVLAALRAYQNADGGFGNALEPDKRTPYSQPIDMQTALEVLDLLDAFDDPLIPRACDWLAATTTPEGGIPLSLPSANAYPHAPWWTAPENPPASLNPTAAITGLLLKHGVRHAWVERATAYCWKAIEASETEQYHDLMPMITFLEQVPDRPRAGRELARIAERVARPGVVALDPDAAGYVQKPLDWAPRPESSLRRLFDDKTIALHLAALAARQQADGGWPITWDPIAPGVDLEWRGRLTIQALQTLQAYEGVGVTAAA